MGSRLVGRTLLGIVLTVPAVVLGVAAAAYWDGSGIGTGSGETGSSAAVTLSAGAPAAALHPGGQSDVTLTVSNPNESPVQIGSFSLDTSQGTDGFAVDAGHAGCAVATLTFTTQTNNGTGWTVPAKVDEVNGTLPITLPDALAMGVGAANACQSATFTVYLAAGA